MPSVEIENSELMQLDPWDAARHVAKRLAEAGFDINRSIERQALVNRDAWVYTQADPAPDKT